MCNFRSQISDLTTNQTPLVTTYLLTLVQFAGELYGHAEPAQLHRGAVLLAGQEDTVGLDVSVDDVIVVTILQCLKEERLLLVLIMIPFFQTAENGKVNK